MKSFILVVSTLLSLCISGVGNDLTTKFELFQDNYHHHYDVLLCSHNIMKLIDRFKANNISLKKSFVVHVRSLNPPFTEVNAYQSRVGFQKWSFHAFLVQDGIVYDLDFTSEPRVMKVKDYLMAMFYPINKKQQRLLYQVKPALEYNESDFDGTMDRDHYPLKELTYQTVFEK